MDLNLFYYGGSGGFFALHLILLTGQFECKFNQLDLDFGKVFESQWKIKSMTNWKVTEFPPDNAKTLVSDIQNKVYLTCNDFKKWSILPGKKIVLYTDIDTQWYLAKNKKAFWFKESGYDSVVSIQTYNKIKGDNWPSCETYEQFMKLPELIYNECVNDFNFTWHPTLAPNLMVALYNNERIFTHLKTLIDTTEIDILVKLQDLIKTNGDILFEQLGISGNAKCKEFVEMYLQLHTEEQRTYLLS